MWDILRFTGCVQRIETKRPLSVQERTPEIFHRYGDVLFNAAPADAEAGSDFGVAQSLQLVQPERRPRSLGKPLYRSKQPVGFVAFIGCVLRGTLPSSGQRQVGSPLIVAEHPPVPLPKPVDHQVLSHAIQIGLAVAYFRRRLHVGLEPKILKNVLGFSGIARAGTKQPQQLRAVQMIDGFKSYCAHANSFPHGPHAALFALPSVRVVCS